MDSLYHGHVEVVDALLKANASVGAMDSNGNTPFVLALHRRHDRVIKSLFEAGFAETVLSDEMRARLVEGSFSKLVHACH